MDQEPPTPPNGMSPHLRMKIQAIHWSSTTRFQYLATMQLSWPRFRAIVHKILLQRYDHAPLREIQALMLPLELRL